VADELSAGGKNDVERGGPNGEGDGSTTEWPAAEDGKSLERQVGGDARLGEFPSG
jgi:hypothetical protein